MDELNFNISVDLNLTENIDIDIDQILDKIDEQDLPNTLYWSLHDVDRNVREYSIELLAAEEVVFGFMNARMLLHVYLGNFVKKPNEQKVPQLKADERQVRRSTKIIQRLELVSRPPGKEHPD